MNIRKDTIPNNLKEYRVKSGYTQQQVSTMLGFTNSVSLSHWESGKNIPGLINVLKISVLYKASVAELYKDLYETILSQQINK
jgi:transcriptional regulator with XRE-family HTH domain